MSVRIERGDLESLVAAALGAAGTREEAAASVARSLVAAEIDGHAGHGLSRVASYAAQVRAGKIDGQAVPKLVETRPATVMVDAAHGFAYPAFDLAITDLAERAGRQGIAAAGVHRSHHGGAVGLQVERLAEAGHLALMFANTPHAMAPFAGRKAVYGTNPIAFACPRPGRSLPVVVDMALSEVARGRIVAAAAKGEAIPEGWALDRNGEPTTDAKAALAGTLLPAGGAKGAALALMVEILAAALTGSSLAFEASSFLDDAGGPPGTGQFLLAISPEAFAGRSRVLDRVADLAHAVEVEAGARLPGDRRLALRMAARRDGVAVEQAVLDKLKAMAG